MCGRARLFSDVSEIKLVSTANTKFSAEMERGAARYAARLRLRAQARPARPRHAALGPLIPYWAKDIKVGFANINAKAEWIESKPAFRKAFERRRCLVPVDNFYEWRKTEIGKQPYALALADRGIMALAGVWENWHLPAGEWSAASRSSPPRRMNCVPEFINGCSSF